MLTAGRARDELRRCDVAVLVVDATRGVSDRDCELLSAFAEKAMPCVVAFNKVDLLAAGRDAYGAPIVNYGIAIAHMNGILERSLDPLRGKCS